MSENLLISIIDDDESALSRTVCLIAHMRMPGMTGLELHRHLVATGTPIPTVLVTAHPDGAVRTKALKAPHPHVRRSAAREAIQP